MFEAILWVAFGCGLSCLVGMLIFMYLLSRVLTGQETMSGCSFCQRQRERWKRLVARIRGKRA